jgi:hypothetical protein
MPDRVGARPCRPSRDAIEWLAQLLEALEMGLDESSDVVGDRVHWGSRRVLACLKEKKGWSVLEAAAPNDEVDFEDRGGGLDGPSGVVIGHA